MMMYEFINHKIGDDKGLEDKETLYFAPFRIQLEVVPHTYHHVYDHHSRLNAYPDSLYRISHFSVVFSLFLFIGDQILHDLVIHLIACSSK